MFNPTLVGRKKPLVSSNMVPEGDIAHRTWLIHDLDVHPTYDRSALQDVIRCYKCITVQYFIITLSTME